MKNTGKTSTAPSNIQQQLEGSLTMENMGFEHHAYDDMTVEQLAVIRDYGLERVHTVTEVLKRQVKESHERGVNIKKLARQAGVTRPTIYKWLSE